MESEYGKDVAETSGSAKIIKKADENAGNDENTKKMIQKKIKKKKRLYCGYMMRIRIRRSQIIFGFHFIQIRKQKAKMRLIPHIWNKMQVSCNQDRPINMLSHRKDLKKLIRIPSNNSDKSAVCAKWLFNFFQCNIIKAAKYTQLSYYIEGGFERK